MTTMILDLETNRAHSTIWCAGIAIDGNPSEIVTTAQQLKPILNGATTVVGHNILGFDLPVLESCWNLTTDAKVVDTLVMARLLNPTPEGGHSLKAWGKRIGFDKLDFDVEDFDSGLTEEMATYCKRDVDVTAKLYRVLSEKLKDFSDYSIQLEHDVAAITAQQVRNGFKLDVSVARQWQHEMETRLAEIENDLQQRFPPIVTARWSEKTGKRLKDSVEVFNVGSRQQIAKRLSSLGVKWKSKTPTGAPVVNEDTLAAIDLPEAQMCAEYLGLVKLKGMVDSWLVATNPDTHRIHGYVNPCGAVTGRMTHNKPNLAQIPSLPIARKCFTVEMGNVLVGCDASGLELRCLAHYMNDAAYTKELIEGDIHTANQQAAGLPTRNDAKTFIYAFLYGAGDEKIGKIVGGNAATGKALKDKFLRNVPALRKLREAATKASKKGWIRGVDGRQILCDEEYKALNRLLQSCGAIIMKVAIRDCVRQLNSRNIPFKLVGQIHDEFQIETPEHFGKAVGMIARQSIINAGVELNLNCPLDGEFKIGRNWSETH